MPIWFDMLVMSDYVPFFILTKCHWGRPFLFRFCRAGHAAGASAFSSNHSLIIRSSITSSKKGV